MCYISFWTQSNRTYAYSQVTGDISSLSKNYEILAN